MEEMALCIMTKLKCAVDGVIRVFVLVLGEPFWKCKESGSANLESSIMVSLRMAQWLAPGCLVKLEVQIGART